MTPCTPTKRFTQMAVRAVAVAIVFTCLRAAPAIADDGIEVTLSLPDHILIGEPLPALVRVRNTSDRNRPIVLPDIYRFSRKKIVFSLEKPGASNFVDIAYPDIYVGGWKSMPPAPYPIRYLGKGEIQNFRFSLVYDFTDERRRQRLFDVPGKYRIRVSVFEPLGVENHEALVPHDSEWRAVQSEAAMVEVRMPEDDRDRRALKALDKLPCEYLLYNPFSFRADCHKEAMALFRLFLHEYKDTRLGRRAALPLGVALSQNLINPIKDDTHTIMEALHILLQDGDTDLRDMTSAVMAELPSADGQP